MGRGLYNTLTWMLTASVVTCSLVPPTISHIHDGGRQTHSHHAAETEHDHHHSGHHHNYDHVSYSTPANGVEVPFAHLHWILLGIDFSFPVPQNDESNRPQNAHEGQFLVVQLNDHVMPSLQVELPETGEYPSILDANHVELYHATDLRGSRWENNSVCRNAHIEWSGVLLI